jgi:hypothetical protein
VLGGIGVASTASGTIGQSEILMQADKLVFVPSSNPNAALTNLMVVGTINGVTTLTIPGSIIGDLTVGTLSIANNAVTIPVAVDMTSAVSINTYDTTIMSVPLDPGGAPMLVLFDNANYLQFMGSYCTYKIKVNGTTVKTVAAPPTISNGSTQRMSFQAYVPGGYSGTTTITVTASSPSGFSYATALADGFLVVIGLKK